MKVDTNIIKMIVTYIKSSTFFFLRQKRFMETTVKSDSIYVKLMLPMFHVFIIIFKAHFCKSRRLNSRHTF